MAITAPMVKDLREKTGAGMMDCKKALTASDGDMEKAIDWLRENGIAKSVKKASRTAAEGLAKLAIDGNRAVLVEVNAETDFVAKNDQFLALLDLTVDTILKNAPKDNEEALALPVNGHTLNDEFINATATIGEKIVLRRFEIVEKADDELFGDYTHMGGSKATVAVLKGGDADHVHESQVHQCCGYRRSLQGTREGDPSCAGDPGERAASREQEEASEHHREDADRQTEQAVQRDLPS